MYIYKYVFIYGFTNFLLLLNTSNFFFKYYYLSYSQRDIVKCDKITIKS